MGGEIGKPLIPFRPMLPKEDREELRLCMEIGVGLDVVRGDLVSVLAGDLFSDRGSTAECVSSRKCCNSGGCCGCCWPVKFTFELDLFSSSSITAAYKRSISPSFRALSSSMTLSSKVTTLACDSEGCLLCPFLLDPHPELPRKPFTGLGKLFIMSTALFGLAPFDNGDGSITL